ncbi:MAG: ABC transporter ATP-binding protein [Firmicutes bacterium]|nr:ABC transporter ATP-binding protein [Alicyclobacillaceae bacterium]MCL6496759.1 ABC transporter ATP-binding protein [Bacillota bacterium]
MADLLEVVEVRKSYGGVQALKSVSFSLAAGEVVALMGPNGAGKTTLVNVICGHTRPDGGVVRLDGRSLAGMGPARVARLGIARTFQNLCLFDHLTAVENVAVAVGLGAYRVSDAILRRWAFRAGEADILGRAEKVLDAVGFPPEARDLTPPMLPYGLRKRLELARALARNPKVLVLDEPVAGMNREEWPAIAGLIRAVAASGVGVLVIEHHWPFVQQVGQRGVFMAHGSVIAQGCWSEILSPREVVGRGLGRADGVGAPVL